MSNDQSGPAPNATGGVIQYKNEPAIVACCLGIVSIFPCFPLGIAAVVYGIAGLKKRKENPALKGSVHAWIGILVGGFFGLNYLLMLVLMLFFGTDLKSLYGAVF